jgi:hypothetical protein
MARWSWSLSAIAALAMSCGGSGSNGGASTPTPPIDDAGTGADAATSDVPPEPPEPPLPPGAAPLVERARRNLQQRMALGDPSEVHLVSVEAKEWNDASLDCPDPEMSYAQVVTPGFVIFLEAAGRTFEYHSDGNYSIILCRDGRPVRGGL